MENKPVLMFVSGFAVGFIVTVSTGALFLWAMIGPLN